MFSYWSKFYVNLITGSEIMIIFFYKGLTKKPEIGSTKFSHNILTLGRVKNTKFGTDVSNEILLNAEKYRFYHIWVIKENHQGWVGKINQRLGLKKNFKQVNPSNALIGNI